MNYTEKGSKLYLFSIVLVEFTAFFCIIHDIND